MDEIEKTLRKDLRKIRISATALQTMLDDYEIFVEEDPTFEAQVILSELYRVTANLHARDRESITEENADDVRWRLFDGKLSRDEVLDLKDIKVEDHMRMLKEEYSPLEVVQAVWMPIIKGGIESVERQLIEGYGKAPPKWKRPDWLVKMEKRGK